MAEELVIGTVLRVEEHPGARAPSLLLTVDLGTYGTHELEGAQIRCRRESDGAIVVGAHSHGKGLVLVRPANEVEPGTLVS